MEAHELHRIVGYPLALAVMAVSCVWVTVSFRKQGWL